MEESIAKQKAAIRKQVGPPAEDGFFSTAWVTAAPSLPAAAPPSCDRLPDESVELMVARGAEEAKIDPLLLREVIRKESGFRPCAISPKGAMGMMQLMPETAARLGVADPFDAAQNVSAGARHLKELLDRFGGEVRLALAGYNAGPEAVEQSKRQVPAIAETRDYVDAIIRSLAAGR